MSITQIAPIAPIAPLNSIASVASIEKMIKLNSITSDNTAQINGANSSYSFSDILKGMINSVNETDAATKVDAYNLAMGYTDTQDLHNIEINAIKADLALRTLTSVRNKVLDAYTEIMRITI